MKNPIYGHWMDAVVNHTEHCEDFDSDPAIEDELDSLLTLVGDSNPAWDGEDTQFAVLVTEGFGNPNPFFIGMVWKDKVEDKWHGIMGYCYCGTFPTRDRAANGVSLAYFG